MLTAGPASMMGIPPVQPAYGGAYGAMPPGAMPAGMPAYGYSM